MAKTKKKSLPEHELSDDKALKTVEGILKVNRIKTDAEGQETVLKKDLTTHCEELRDNLAGEGNFIGMVRAVTTEGALRCEFNMKNGCLDVGQETNLNSIFGTARPTLFQKTKVVTGISDPEQLLKDLGTEAFDHLELRVKSGHDEVVIAKSKSVVCQGAFIPQADFLANIKELANVLTDNAKTWLKDYLIRALGTRVVVGSRGATKS